MRLIIIFVVLCLIKKSIQNVEFYEEKTTPKDQILCVKTAFRKFFNDHSNVLIFSAKPNDIVNSLPRLPHFVATKSDSVRKISSVDRGAMIIFLEGNGEQDFTDLKRLLGIVTVQPVFVVCITNAVCSSEMYINKIVRMVNGAQLHYVAVNDEGIIDVYEYTTTAEGDCGVAQLVRLGHCSDKSTAKRASQTSVNFHECPMRVVTRFWPSYSELCSSGASNDLCGIDGFAVQSVAELVNATPVSLVVQTAEDIRQLVARRYADIGFGKLHLHSEADVSHSIPYSFVQGTVVAPHSTWTSKGSIGSILLPLNFEVWVGLGVVIVSVSILRMFVPYFRRIHSLQMFGIILGISLPRQPRQLPSRIFFLTVVFFGYLFSQSYLANLTKVLSTTRQSFIDTLDELEKSDLRVIGSANAREFFKHDYPRIHRDFQSKDISEYLVELHELLSGRSSSALYVEAPGSTITGWKTVKRIDDEIGWFPIQMVFPNSSAVSKTADKVLRSLLEGGLLKEYATMIGPMSQHRYEGHSDSKSLGKSVVLGLEDLRGVFFLLIAGLSLSFIVFLIEIMTPFIRRKVRDGLKRRGYIHSEGLRQRHVRGISLPRQTSRASRR